MTRERVVWSSQCGGCLMLQRYDAKNKAWIDWASFDEGSFPTHDIKAKAAVKRSNALLRARSLDERARQLQLKAAKLAMRATSLREGVSVKPKRPTGMSAYERAERSFDAY